MEGREAMKILIIGAGKIGSAIVRNVCHESHEVTVIDNDPEVIERIVNQYDVMGICGNGLSNEILKSVDIERTDLVIAVTQSDEANMLACQFAHQLGAKNTIARVRDYSYTKQIGFLESTLKLTLSINPELEAAREIARIVNFPEARKIDTFAGGNADLIELSVPEDCSICNKSLSEINREQQINSLICAVTRKNEVYIPDGKFVIMPNDIIHVTSDRLNSRLFLSKLGLSKTKMKEIIIIGGGRISVHLAEILIKNRYNVKIIEQDLAVCEELSQLVPEAIVVCGDGSDQALLKEQGMAESDAIICLTGLDEENIIISLYANKQNVKKVITKINKPSFKSLLESIKMSSVISPQEITASQITSYIRASQNSMGNKCKTLYKLVDNKVEALEFEVSSQSNVINTELRSLKLKPQILIAGIIRDSEFIIPRGTSKILPNDSVIVVTTDNILNDLDDILA